MSNVSKWSPTAASNNATPPDGFPEAMAPSGVNNAARELMAAVRRWYDEAEWRSFDDTPAQASSTSFTVSGDHRSVYHAGRRVRVTEVSGTHVYGTVSSVSFSSNTRVSVNVDSANLSVSLSAVAVGPTRIEDSVPRVLHDLNVSSSTLSAVTVHDLSGTSASLSSVVANALTGDSASFTSVVKIQKATKGHVGVKLNAPVTGSNSALMAVDFAGDDDGNNDTGYARILGVQFSESDGSELGGIIVRTNVDGSGVDSAGAGRVVISKGIYTLNASGGDQGADTLNASELYEDGARVLTLGGGVMSGNFDLNGNDLILDSDGDTSITADTDDQIDIRLQGQDLLVLDGTAATVINGFTMTFAATGSSPTLSATGNDTNIDMTLTPKGTGRLVAKTNQIRISAAANEATLRTASSRSTGGIGRIQMIGHDAGANETIYAEMETVADTATDGAEDGHLQVKTIQGGTLATRFNVATGIYTENATGGDQGADTLNASELYEDGTRVLTLAGGTVTGTVTFDASATFAATPTLRDGADVGTAGKKLDEDGSDLTWDGSKVWDASNVSSAPGLTISKSSKGHADLPGGVTHKWGKVTVSPNDVTTESFSTSFSSAPWQAVLTVADYAVASNLGGISYANLSTSSIDIWNQDNGSTVNISYVVIGPT